MRVRQTIARQAPNRALNQPQACSQPYSISGHVQYLILKLVKQKYTNWKVKRKKVTTTNNNKAGFTHSAEQHWDSVQVVAWWTIPTENHCNIIKAG